MSGWRVRKAGGMAVSMITAVRRTCYFNSLTAPNRHDRARGHVHRLLSLVSQVVRPSFIFAIFASGPAGLVHSWYEPFFFRRRSSRARACRVGVRMPEAFARRVKNSWYVSLVS